MYGRIHEDLSTRLTPPSRKRTVFRGALNLKSHSFFSRGKIVHCSLIILTGCQGVDLKVLCDSLMPLAQEACLRIDGSTVGALDLAKSSDPLR